MEFRCFTFSYPTYGLALGVHDVLAERQNTLRSQHNNFLMTTVTMKS